MLIPVNSQLNGTLNSTGAAFYTVTLRNGYNLPINNLAAEMSFVGPPGCPITPEQVYASEIHINYLNGGNTVPPNEEVVIIATITTDNAPTSCQGAPFMLVAPSISVQFQFVGGPPTYNAQVLMFTIMP